MVLNRYSESRRTWSTVWVKKPLKFSGFFSQMVGNILSKFYTPVVHSYLRSTTIFLFNYLQSWRSYAIKSATMHPVHIICATLNDRPKPTLAFSGIFRNSLEFLVKISHVLIYVRLYFFIQLSPTTTKLYHIKCNHPACV